MGHDYIEFGEHRVLLDDMDIWTLRHFFSRGIQLTAPEDLGTDRSTLKLLRIFFESWDWLGPGVCTGADFGEFVQNNPSRRAVLQKLFQRTIDYLNGFGEVIPLEYLDEHINIPAMYFTSEVPVNRFTKCVEKLRTMFVEP